MAYRNEGFCLECKEVVRWPHTCPKAGDVLWTTSRSMGNAETHAHLVAGQPVSFATTRGRCEKCES